MPWLGPSSPAALGLEGQGESRAVLRGEMSKNSPFTEGGWELGQGRAQLLEGICRGRGLRTFVGRRDRGSISGTSLYD